MVGKGGARESIFYPLAQQSCGGDIGSVPYVCMWFVRMFTRSSDLIYYPISI